MENLKLKKIETLKLLKTYLSQSSLQNVSQTNNHDNGHDNSGGHPDYHNDSHDNTPSNIFVMEDNDNKSLSLTK